MTTIVRQLLDVEKTILARRYAKLKEAEQLWNEALVLVQQGDPKTRVNLDAGVVERVSETVTE